MFGQQGTYDSPYTPYGICCPACKQSADMLSAIQGKPAQQDDMIYCRTCGYSPIKTNYNINKENNANG